MSEKLIKKRKVSIEKIKDKYREKEIEKLLDNEPGIIFIEVNGQKGYINIEYDLQQIKFEKIERRIEKMEINLSKKITEKFKRGLAKFTEQNELDNLKAVPSSCCSDPKEIFPKVK